MFDRYKQLKDKFLLMHLGSSLVPTFPIETSKIIWQPCLQHHLSQPLKRNSSNQEYMLSVRPMHSVTRIQTILAIYWFQASFKATHQSVGYSSCIFITILLVFPCSAQLANLLGAMRYKITIINITIGTPPKQLSAWVVINHIIVQTM